MKANPLLLKIKQSTTKRMDCEIDDKPPVFSSKKTPGVVYFRDIYRKRISRLADPTNHVAFSSLLKKQLRF
jgi:hypothetical protein